MLERSWVSEPSSSKWSAGISITNKIGNISVQILAKFNKSNEKHPRKVISKCSKFGRSFNDKGSL